MVCPEGGGGLKAMVELRMRPTKLDAERTARPLGGWHWESWALGSVTWVYFSALEGAVLAFVPSGATRTRGGYAAGVDGGGTVSPSESSAGVSWSPRERLSPVNEVLSGRS